MTVLAFLFVAFFGAAILCLLLGRRNSAPQDEGEWHRMLSTDLRRLVGALELQTTADRAMTRNAMSRAKRARDSRRYRECLRLVDIVSDLLASVVEDRITRLRGMGICLRMVSAVAPVPPLLPQGVTLTETRALFAFGAIFHHFLVSAWDRLRSQVFFLGLAYRLTLRAFLRSQVRLASTPQDLEAWTGCQGPVDDLTGVLDPAHIQVFRALMASAERVA